ncbi:restriction endonuclease subunit S [Aeromonas caviae]|uniref:restriction endonuclease subunit S n=1 Tax=Aeromonas caviae TaxID=648 RepID=UPI0038D165FA
MKAGWHKKKLGDVLQLEYGKPLDATNRNPNGLYPVYGANGEKDRSDSFFYDKPSIIVGRKGSAGEVNLTEERFWPLDVTYYVTFDDNNYDLQFLYYLLLHLELPSLAKGVKPGINRNEVYSLSVNISSLPEQQRIVAILDETFEAIAAARANAEQNRQNARALFESYLQSVFSQRGDGWTEKPLGEMATFRNGVNFTKSSQGEPIKILGVKDFQNYYWAPLNSLDSIIPDGTLPDTDTLQQNDIVFVRSNGNPELIGRCLLIGEVQERTTFSGFTIRARRFTEEVLPQYLCHFLKSSHIRRELVDGGNGANIRSLNQGALSKLRINFPVALSEQERIVEQLETMQSETQHLESLYQRKIAALDELKQSLLQQAFSGQL